MFARYALPIVPFMALWGGVASGWVIQRVQERAWPATSRKAVVAVLVAAAVLPPLAGSIEWVRLHGVETTQLQAWKWTRANIWPGSRIVSEARTFDLPSERYGIEVVQRLWERDPEALRASGVEWVILSSDAWRDRSAAERAQGKPPQAYAALMAAADQAKAFLPSPAVPGPELHILRLAPR